MSSVGGPTGYVDDYHVSTVTMWFLVLSSFLVTRLSIIPAILEFRSDEVLYQGWAVMIGSGQFPLGDDLYQYPPAAGLIFWLQDLTPGDYHRVFTLSMIASDALILGLLLVQVSRRGASWRGPWAWVIGGALSGTLLYERYDVLPTFLAVLALVLVPRPYLSGFIAGIGGMVKVWPVLVLFALRRDQLLKGIIGAVAGVILVTLFATFVARDPFSFLVGQAARGLQIEAVLAAPILLASQFGLVSAPTVNRFGSNELDSDLATVVAWIGILIALVMLSLLLLQMVRGKFATIPCYDIAFAAVLVFVVFNRVNSSQFFIWIAGISAVVLLDRRSRMVVPVVIAFLSMFAVKEYLGPFFWALQAQYIEPVLLQFVRASLLAFSALLAWSFVFFGRAYKSRTVPDHSRE